MATEALTPTETDDSVRKDVLSELKWDPKISSNDIGVAVKDGVVTLTRSVSSYWERDAIEKAAKRIHGVSGVANDIQIKLACTRSDSEIAEDVMHALESHVGIPWEKIKAVVKNGWVTLEGVVDWPYQRFLAESAVKKLKGVAGITNNIEYRARY